jgi:transcriptional regulator with XRE-family HTH domain
VLAERAGVAEQMIQRIERGERITDETLKQVAKALFTEEHAFVGLCYIPSEEKAFKNALKYLPEHSVVDVHRISSPGDIEALLDTQGWIVDGSDVVGGARELVAILQESLMDWSDGYRAMPEAEQHDTRDNLFRQVNRIEHAASAGKYGVLDVLVAKVPGRLGILKFWPRGDPRARLSQILLSKQQVRLW